MSNPHYQTFEENVTQKSNLALYHPAHYSKENCIV